MRSDDVAFLESLDRKTVNFSSSPRDRIINVQAEYQASSSSGSSPSDLRKRLQDLPSSNEFTLLADRVAALGRRISHKRDHFLRLYGGVANRIEENDEWEEKSEQRVESAEILSTVFRPRNARARRRAQLLLQNSQFHDDKAMVISHNNDITDSNKLIQSDKRNSTEFSADRSVEDRDYSRLPSIKVSRRQPRVTSISEPTSTRLSHQNIHDNSDIGSNAGRRSCRNYTQRDNASKPTNLPSVSPFTISNIRLRNFGRHRAPSSVILKNLSSGSDSEPTSGANSQILYSDRKIDGSSITLDGLSSPKVKITTAVNGPIQKMPIMSARSDITRSILPNLIPSARSVYDNNIDRETFQDTPRNYIPVKISRDDSTMKISRNEVSKIVRDGSRPTIYDEITNCSLNKNVETFLKRDIISESAKNSEEVVTRVCNKFVEIESAPEDMHNEKGTTSRSTLITSGRGLNTEISIGNYFIRSSERSHNNMEVRQSDLNCPTNQFDQNNTKNGINKDNLDIAEWGQELNLCKKGINDTSRLIATKVHENIKEDDLSSQNSELLESEEPSCSSGRTKIQYQNEILNENYRKAILSSAQTHQNSDIDRSHKCDQEITNVPILVLNSQDISYSTSADSRGCSAGRSLDTHALMKALSDVSLKQATEKENDSSKYENSYRQREMVLADVPPDFLRKEKTWHLSRSSVSKLSEKSSSLIPSRIPVRVCDKQIINKSTGVKNPVLEYDQDSSKIRNYEEQILIDQNKHGYTSEMFKEAKNLSDQTYKPNISLKLKNENDEITVFQDSNTNSDYRIGSLISLNLPGNLIHDKMRYQSEGYFSDKSCPSAFFHETICPADRDFSKIDDDVRSKSDCSTSRRSTETMDITSATESSRLIRYKEIPKKRNIEENVTWRTEDECVSINDEDTKDKDYCESYDKKFEHSSMKRHFDDITQEITGELFPSKMRLRHHVDALPFEKASIKQRFSKLENNKNKSSLEDDSEPTKIIQSRSLTSQKHWEQIISNFTARISSSTLNLSTEPKKKKKKKNKSQERFPFTISETVNALSIKPEDTIKRQIANNDVQITKMDDQLEEMTIHRLKVHPSLTRLATSGLENTTSEILRCAVQEHEEEKRISSSSKSRIKRFVQLFSLKLRRKRQCNLTAESTKIIYENRVCQANSRANSCSDDSLMMDGELNIDKFANKRLIVLPVARSKPILVSDKNILTKNESLEEIRQQYSHRRYDRDNLWVQNFKDNNLFDEEPENKSSPNEIENSMEQNLMEDQYKFLSENYQYAKAEFNIVRDNTLRETECIETPISEHETISVTKSKEEIDEKLDKRLNETEEDLTDCLCLKLCRLIALSKYRLSTVEEVSSKSEKERSDFLMRKRKK